MHQIILEHIKVPYLNKDRQLRIYLPPNYKDEENFPVIYMHDGQNLFDESTSSYGAIWDVATHLNNIYKKIAAGFICVGIDNDPKGFNRLDEYSPWVNTSLQTSQQLEGITGPVGGLGKQYLKFITECVKPHIDQNYKSNPSNETTAIMGSSMGGLISLYHITQEYSLFCNWGMNCIASLGCYYLVFVLYYNRTSVLKGGDLA